MPLTPAQVKEIASRSARSILQGSTEIPATITVLETVETPVMSSASKKVIIKEEPHPLKAGASVFRVYEMGGTPLYIGRETKEEVLSYLRSDHPDWEVAEESTCPNLLPMAEWIKGDEPGTCRPCILTPVVQWYWQELKERGYEDLAKQLEAEVDVLEEDNVEQVMALCKDLDEIKAGVPADLRKRLEDFDCAIQNYELDESGEAEAPAG